MVVFGTGLRVGTVDSMGAELVVEAVGATLKIPLGAGLLVGAVGAKVLVGEADVPIMTGARLLAVGPDGGGVPRPVVGTTEGAFGPVGFGLLVGDREAPPGGLGAVLLAGD